MLIKDLQSGTVRKYGSDCHDSLDISQDGRTLRYYNLQCGDGSQYGDFRFVMEDGEVPQDSNTPDAKHCECYFNIGGFDRNLVAHDKQIRDEVIDCVTEKYFDVVESVLHDREIGIELNQALSIYAKIMNCCNEIAEQMKGEQNE